MLVFAELGAGQHNLVNMITTTQAERERFRVQRKLMHQGVGIQQVKKYRDFQNDESKVVALDLLSTPEDYVAHFERYATSVVSIIGFGRRVGDPKDPIITEVIAVMHLAADLNVPGKTFPMLMETFPGERVPNHTDNPELICYSACQSSYRLCTVETRTRTEQKRPRA